MARCSRGRERVGLYPYCRATAGTGNLWKGRADIREREGDREGLPTKLVLFYRGRYTADEVHPSSYDGKAPNLWAVGAQGTAVWFGTSILW